MAALQPVPREATPPMTQTRADAWALVTEFVQSDSLRKHMLAVEGSMRYYAEKLGQDVEYWGIAGLIHDFDYERHPTLDEHVWVGSRILAERGWPAELIRTIQSHADYMNVVGPLVLMTKMIVIGGVTSTWSPTRPSAPPWPG